VARTPQVAQPVADRTQAVVVPGANPAGGHANIRDVGDWNQEKATRSVRFQALMAACMKMTVWLHTAQYNMVKIY
jgi:hypothetical protein